MPSCYYLWFRKTTGAEPDIKQGQIVGNHFNGVMAYDADVFKHQDDTDYGVLETDQTNHDAMETSIVSGGTYGKHVDDPEGTPVLADGDPA
jgi:hypothetical protein